MRPLTLAAVLLVAACNTVSGGDVFSPHPQADAGLPVDAGVTTGGGAAGATDAGQSPDAGVARDGGSTSMNDAGAVTTDAGTCTPQSDRANWPVKVVFVVQNSGALCVLDPPGSQGTAGFCEQVGTSTMATIPARIKLINSFFTDNATRPNVSIAVIPYATNAVTLPFRAAPSGAHPELAALQSSLGKGSNLQGALEAAKQLLVADVQASTPALRARTRYAVVVLSTGLPFPRCAANDGLSMYASATEPQLVWADAPGSGTFCNTVMPGDPDAITGFTAGGDLNQNAQLFGLVDDIVGLDAQYGLGDVRLFTRSLLDDTNIITCGPICADLLGPQSLSDSHRMSSWLQTQLALHGQGSFTDLTAISQLSLQGIDTSEFTTFCGP